MTDPAVRQAGTERWRVTPWQRVASAYHGFWLAWAVAGLGPPTIFWGLACIATGLPVFLWVRRRKGTVS